MISSTKRLVWGLAIAMPLSAATVVAFLFVYGLPPFMAPLLKRPATKPTSEDYAAYSAFVDGFFSSNQPSRAGQSISQDSAVYIVGETLQMKNPDDILPLEVAALGPKDMGEDFFKQNTQAWLLQPHIHAGLRVSLVGYDMMHRAASSGMEELFVARPKKGEERKWLPHPRPASPFPDDPSVSGVLQLSRAGFNRQGTMALLYYSYRCGALCGQSGWAVLYKTQGNWRIQKFGPRVVY